MSDKGLLFGQKIRNGITGEKNKFQEFLNDNYIKHIPGRIDHPQTNGKLEMLNYTVKRSRPYFNTWEDVLYYYNYERRHISLSIDERPAVTHAMSYEEKGGKLNGQ